MPVPQSTLPVLADESQTPACPRGSGSKGHQAGKEKASNLHFHGLACRDQAFSQIGIRPVSSLRLLSKLCRRSAFVQGCLLGTAQIPTPMVGSTTRDCVLISLLLWYSSNHAHSQRTRDSGWPMVETLHFTKRHSNWESTLRGHS
jgi:hypothetical protein